LTWLEFVFSFTLSAYFLVSNYRIQLVSFFYSLNLFV